MTRLSSVLALLGLLCGTLFLGPVAVAARDTSVESLNAKRLEAVKRWELSARGRNGGGNARRAALTLAPPRVKNITFSNPKASRAYAIIFLLLIASSHVLPDFYVEGTTIPQVNFDVGPSWSGLIPISSAPNETRKVWFQRETSQPGQSVSLRSQLFFWLFPPGPEGSLDDLIFWYVTCYGLRTKPS